MTEAMKEVGASRDQPVTVIGQQGVYDLMFPNFADMDFHQAVDTRRLQREIKLTPILRSLGVQLSGDPKQQLLLRPEIAVALQKVGGILTDLSAVKHRIILPPPGDEMQIFIQRVAGASITGEPILFYAPCCPDWSQDSEGMYDYKSLGGGPSFIAEKFFTEAPPVLEALQRQDIPYKGSVVIADWGLENDIEAYDKGGERLSRDEVAARFLSTAGHAQQRMEELNRSTGIFEEFDVILMSDFFQQRGIDPDATYQEARAIFETNSRGIKLVNELHTASLPINRRRRGLTEEQNRSQAAQGVAEYATFSSALPDNGTLFAAESQTTSKAYNTLRQTKVPVFFLKGESKQAQAVNIL